MDGSFRTILMPQNAWPWSGHAGHVTNYPRYFALRMLSELSMRRASGVLRIGSSIPPHGRVLNDDPLPNVLDREFENALQESRRVGRQDWRETFVLAGSLAPYRNARIALEALSHLEGSVRVHLTDDPSRNVPPAPRNVNVSVAHLSRPSLLYAMREAPAVIFPSLVEASPVALLEAQAVGARIVVSSIPGHCDVVCSESSVTWFPATDVGTLTRALKTAKESTVGRTLLSTPEGRTEARHDWLHRLMDGIARL